MKPKYVLEILLVIAVFLGIWFYSQNNNDEPAREDSQQNTQQNNQSESAALEEIPNGLRGELRTSTDFKRGNLMLLMENSDRVIYLNTSRDFSSLVGKNVIVNIEGSMDDFRLLDIKEQ